MLRAAVSLAVSRRSRSGELLLVERSRELRSFAGLQAFPGGTLDSADERVEVHGLDDASLGPIVAAGARELFEETGIWLGRGRRTVDGSELRRARTELLAGDVDLGALLQRFGHRLEGRDFLPLCRLTTPPFAPVRFDTTFLRVVVDDGASVDVWDGELVAGGFVDAVETMERWRRGEVRLAPPMVVLLDEWALGEDGAVARIRKLAASYERGAPHRIYFSPGVLLVPLKTPTRPPATHTNTLVIGEERLYVVDPSPIDETERERLWTLLEGLLEEGRELQGILLTHYHPDHVGALAEMQRRFAVSARAHRDCMAELPDVPFGEPVEHGETIELGSAPDGSSGWSLTAYHVPGHARGHLAFEESRYRAMVVGDLVSTLSSILIDPADGHLRTYLDSLRFLAGRAQGVLYPGHGPPAMDGRAALRKALEHRQEREDQLLEALSGEPRTTGRLVQAIYTDVPPQMHALAERSLLSGLIKLEEDGRAERTDAGWRKPGGRR